MRGKGGWKRRRREKFVISASPPLSSSSSHARLGLAHSHRRTRRRNKRTTKGIPAHRQIKSVPLSIGTTWNGLLGHIFVPFFHRRPMMAHSSSSSVCPTLSSSSLSSPSPPVARDSSNAFYTTYSFPKVVNKLCRIPLPRKDRFSPSPQCFATPPPTYSTSHLPF